jgi:glutamate synthase (NADPH/NADH) large chain
MSGGIAYFLDLDLSLLNTELVDPVEPTKGDLELLRGIVVRQQEETGSEVAARLLADWDTSATRFTKVLPRDYARVLAARELAESEGLDDATTTTRMMEAAHG